MNNLLMDTSTANKISVSLQTSQKKYYLESEQKFGSQALLGLIQDILNDANLELKDLTEIRVNIGPGSFTGLRVGVSVANALGYGLGIPVNGKQIETEVVY